MDVYVHLKVIIFHRLKQEIKKGDHRPLSTQQAPHTVHIKNLAPSISYCSCGDCLLLLQLQATHPVMSISIFSLSMCSRPFKISLCALWCFLWLCITFNWWHLLLLPSPIWTDPCPDLLGTQCLLQSRGVHDSLKVLAACHLQPRILVHEYWIF